MALPDRNGLQENDVIPDLIGNTSGGSGIYAVAAASAQIAPASVGVILSSTFAVIPSICPINTEILLHFDDIGATTADYCNNATVTMNSTPGSNDAITATLPLYGTGSFESVNDGASDGAVFITHSFPNSAAWTLEGNIAVADITAWGLVGSFAFANSVVGYAYENATGLALATVNLSSNGIAFDIYDSVGWTIPAIAPFSNVYINLCLQYDGFFYTFFQDGVPLISVASALSLFPVTEIIMGAQSGAFAVPAFLDEVRLSSVARYSNAGYTPPSSAFFPP